MANQIDDKPLLPNEYRQLEYLEFTGTQWIDTRITPILSDEIECECIIKEFSSTRATLFISGFNDVKWTYSPFKIVDNSITASYKYFEGGAARSFTVFNHSKDMLNIIKFKNDGQISFNYVEYFVTPNTFNDIVLSTPLYIGRGSSAPFFIGTIGKFKLMDRNGELKLNLIPALRKSDSKPGMYDLVTDQFFTNQGTGEFGYG